MSTGHVYNSSRTGRVHGALIVALVVVALAIVALLFWSVGRPVQDAASAHDERAPSPSALSASPPAASLADEHADERAAVQTSTPAAAAPHTAPAAPEHNDTAPPVPYRVHGFLLDVRGGALAGVRVGDAKRADAIHTTSAFDGGFELELTGDARLCTLAPEWATMRSAVVRAQNHAQEQYVIAARAIDVAGHVVDPGGKALSGATVALGISLGTFASFPHALDYSGLEAFRTRTDADGAFVLKSIPGAQKYSIVVELAGYGSSWSDLPTEPVHDLVLTLGAMREVQTTITGVVVHADGSPAPQASVHIANIQAHTDARGAFELPVKDVEPDAALVAIEAGCQPAVVERYGDLITATDAHPPPVRLVLGAPPLTIEGRVLSAAGEPCAHFTVEIADGTAVSQKQMPIVTAEALTAQGKQTCVTTQDGAFRIEGLSQRSQGYRLQAYDALAGTMLRSQPIAAGTHDALLQFPSTAKRALLAGRVVARDGTPVAGVTLALYLDTSRTSFGSVTKRSSHSAQSKADGTFAFADAPVEFIHLELSGEAILPQTKMLDGLDLDHSFDVVVERRCRLRVEASASTSANQVGVLDRDGKELALWTFFENTTMSMSRAELSEGTTQVLTVSEDAARLVLYKNQAPVASVPLQLAAGELTVVRP